MTPAARADLRTEAQAEALAHLRRSLAALHSVACSAEVLAGLGAVDVRGELEAVRRRLAAVEGQLDRL